MRANIRRWYADPKVAEAVFAVISDGSPTSAWGDDAFARMASRFVGFQTQEEALPLDAPLARHRAPAARAPGRESRRIIRRSHDAQRAVQWGPGVCAYNVYPPYGHYEDHVPAVERLAAAFLAEEQPYTLSGAEQRFVNELWLTRSDRPSELFSFYPPLGAEFERRHVPLRLEVEVEHADGIAVVATLARGADGDGVLYTLEIAARATRGIEPDVTAIVEWHNRAHQAVNDAFERAITDETRRRLRQV
ncbi:MAG: TIGR04255 family protein [Deltaproteobacteria bacterium]|nr:TIGR04255 family protein [Deltaproteobacteria bacterium]